MTWTRHNQHKHDSAKWRHSGLWDTFHEVQLKRAAFLSCIWKRKLSNGTSPSRNTAAVINNTNDGCMSLVSVISDTCVCLLYDSQNVTLLTSAPTPKVTIEWFFFSVFLCVPLFIVVFALLHSDQSLQLRPPSCWLTQCSQSSSSTGCHHAASGPSSHSDQQICQSWKLQTMITFSSAWSHQRWTALLLQYHWWTQMRRRW